jgi:branched-chain amino acid transport system ATP-binding protein|tara:strand:- start:226 stop:990 length:765 start_codon:yes stop_codon:yes gene_type:complete
MEPLLKVQGVSVNFSGLKALANVTFDAHAGEVRAVIGPNGAGKTTLFNAISGYEESTEGTIYFKGTPIHGLAPHEIAIKGVRRTFQNGGLFPELTALENVLAGLHMHIDGSFLGIVMGLGEAREAEREGIARARRLLDLMDLGAIADQPVKDLSGGQQRMVEIVRTLATEPPLLLLDEPVVGLAPPMRARMMEIIRRLAGEEGIGIMLIEHVIDLVMSGSDVIVVLSSGEVIAEGTPDEIRQNREVLEAYLGHA